MSDLYTKRWYFYTLMAVSLAFGTVFFSTNNLEFIIAATEFKKLHFSNIAYAVTRSLNGIVLPLIFVAPSITQFSRIKSAKAIFIIYGICYFLTTTWVIPFLSRGYNLFEYDEIYAFQSTFTNAYISSYVFWDTYTLIGILYSVIYGSLCIYTGISFDDNRIKVRRCVMLLLALKFCLPMISNLIYGKVLFSRFWITNNYSDLISTIFFTVAIFFASLSKKTWIDFIWNQGMIDENDESGA